MRVGRGAMAIVVVAVLLAGCGDGDAQDDATTSAAPSAAVTSDAATAGEDRESAAPADADADFDCNDALLELAVLDEQYGYSVRQGTPDEPVDYGLLAADVDAAVAAAPPEIRDAYESYAAAVLPFYAGLAGIGFDASDPGSVDAGEYVALTEELDTERLTQARADIQAWLVGPCEDG